MGFSVSMAQSMTWSMLRATSSMVWGSSRCTSGGVRVAVMMASMSDSGHAVTRSRLPESSGSVVLGDRNVPPAGEVIGDGESRPVLAPLEREQRLQQLAAERGCQPRQQSVARQVVL